MKSDPRYTSESVFQTFPWPQAPTKGQIEAVAAAGVALRLLRTASTMGAEGGLRALYRTIELPGKNPLKDAHAALDAAVLAAYGFSPGKDILQQLLDLNTAVAADIHAGKAVTGPGVPYSYKNSAKLITKDCLGV